jgi:hypothetical protein
MEELCKKDGGTKVYEPVTLPASYFDPDGRLRLSQSMPWGSDGDFRRVGEDEFRIITTKVYLVGKDADPAKGEGSLARWHVAVYRWADRKLLGESIEYWRGGGDRFTFGFQPSSSVCPSLRTSLTSLVLLKGQ